ncbi:MAG: glycosyltransferase family 1 protein [Puniceicoccaceae bacterium]|nr:MAG: glycosyltransferase family 1 protein [Puniceicoccaceae bacterium]
MAGGVQHREGGPALGLRSHRRSEMKIALDVAQTCVERSGCAWHADALARALADLLPPEQLMLYHHFGDWINGSTEAGTRLAGVEEPFRHLDPAAAREIWRAIDAGDRMLPGAPDIVHANSFMCPRIRPARLVYTLHDLCFWTHPAYTTERNRMLCQTQVLRALSAADAFIFVSHQAAEDFEALFPDWLGQSGRPWRVIPSGARNRPERLSEPVRRFRDPVAPWLFIGTIEPRKGLAVLLDRYEVYCSQSKRPRPLHFVGGVGWKAETLLQRIEGLADRWPVRRLGYLSEAALQSAMEGAFALLFPSVHEGFGLPVAEAAIHGLPVLASPVPSYRPIQAEVDFCRDLDAENWIHKMQELEASERLYVEVSHATLRAQGGRTYEGVARETLAFHRSLATPRGRRPRLHPPGMAPATGALPT